MKYLARFAFFEPRRGSFCEIYPETRILLIVWINQSVLVQCSIIHIIFVVANIRIYIYIFNFFFSRHWTADSGFSIRRKPCVFARLNIAIEHTYKRSGAYFFLCCGGYDVFSLIRSSFMAMALSSFEVSAPFFLPRCMFLFYLKNITCDLTVNRHFGALLFSLACWSRWFFENYIYVLTNFLYLSGLSFLRDCGLLVYYDVNSVFMTLFIDLVP